MAKEGLMNPSKNAPRRGKKVELNPETLESRALLTGGTGNMIAILPGTIATPKEVGSTSFTLSSSHFTIPRGKVTLGIDIVPDAAATFKPEISSVEDPTGRAIRGTSRAMFNPAIERNRETGDPRSSAMLVPLTTPRGKAFTSSTFTVKVTGAEDTTGRYLLGFFLPGDADGNGVVDGADVKAVRSALGSTPSDALYKFDADADRDGRINNTDLRITQRNKGAKTTISPVVSANLDPASDSDAADRKTTISTVHFSGEVTPGATVTFTETTQKTAPVSTTADDTGNYSIMVPLATGENSFRVSTQDAFGQNISGGIAPVTRL
jgi:hypothetical protein